MAKKLVITGTSAMQAWDEGVGAYARPTRVRTSAQFATTAAELAEFTTLPQGCTQPVEILVGDAGNRVNSKRWLGKLRRSPLPMGSIWDVGEGRYITFAGYFFLERAAQLSFVRAVLLGMELCGWYSTLMSVPYREYCDAERVRQGGALLTPPWPPAEWDLSLAHEQNLVDNGFVTRKPLSDAASLRAYLEGALSPQSNARALVAARQLQDHSHSPMESRLYARYCLPRRYGGQNLHPVELNRGFKISQDIAQAIGITEYSVDLYWPDAGMAIEYQGKHAHSGLSAEQRDRLKRNVLDIEGVRILSIDSKQVDNEDMMDRYGYTIARAMGIPDWKLRQSPREQARRNALANELREMDADLYRS